MGSTQSIEAQNIVALNNLGMIFCFPALIQNIVFNLRYNFKLTSERIALMFLNLKSPNKILVVKVDKFPQFLIKLSKFF